jgi:hypothetical protein
MLPRLLLTTAMVACLADSSQADDEKPLAATARELPSFSARIPANAGAYCAELRRVIGTAKDSFKPIVVGAYGGGMFNFATSVTLAGWADCTVSAAAAYLCDVSFPTKEEVVRHYRQSAGEVKVCLGDRWIEKSADFQDLIGRAFDFEVDDRTIIRVGVAMLLDIVSIEVKACRAKEC